MHPTNVEAKNMKTKRWCLHWCSRTFGRLVRWSNLPPYCLRFWKMDRLFKTLCTNA